MAIASRTATPPKWWRQPGKIYLSQVSLQKCCLAECWPCLVGIEELHVHFLLSQQLFHRLSQTTLSANNEDKEMMRQKGSTGFKFKRVFTESPLPKIAIRYMYCIRLSLWTKLQSTCWFRGKNSAVWLTKSKATTSPVSTSRDATKVQNEKLSIGAL